MDARYQSMASMMGAQQATAQVPTQSFNAANILGTPLPVVGNSNGSGTHGYAGSVGQNIPKIHIALWAVGLVGVGYLVYHVNFEK